MHRWVSVCACYILSLDNSIRAYIYLCVYPARKHTFVRLLPFMLIYLRILGSLKKFVPVCILTPNIYIYIHTQTHIFKTLAIPVEIFMYIWIVMYICPSMYIQAQYSYTYIDISTHFQGSCTSR